MRLLYGLLGVTWMGWAMIGLLSGHRFMLVSRRGPIHLSGPAALVFCIAVAASATACLVGIVDHYDRRDHETPTASCAAACGCLRGRACLAGLVGWAERLDFLPLTDGRLGALSTSELRDLLASSWLNELLARRHATIEKWALVALAWMVIASPPLRALGVNRDGVPPGIAMSSFVVFCVIAPAFVMFALMLLPGWPPCVVSDAGRSRRGRDTQPTRFGAFDAAGQPRVHRLSRGDGCWPPATHRRHPSASSPAIVTALIGSDFTARPCRAGPEQGRQTSNPIALTKQLTVTVRQGAGQRIGVAERSLGALLHASYYSQAHL